MMPIPNPREDGEEEVKGDMMEEQDVHQQSMNFGDVQDEIRHEEMKDETLDLEYSKIDQIENTVAYSEI